MVSEILTLLEGGERRSVGRVPEVVEAVLREPGLFEPLFLGLLSDDPVVRMRAADAVEKLTAIHPEYLQPYAERLLQVGSASTQQEVRWHVAQMLPRLTLGEAAREEAVAVLLAYLGDKSKIVQVFALQALAELAKEDGALRPQVIARLEEATHAGSPAVRSRGRKLLAWLAKA